MPNFETSFIPEQGSSYSGGSRRSVVATVFSVIFIISAVALSGYAWWLEQAELKKVKNLEAELSSMEQQFDIPKITQLANFDKKIDFAKGMLNKHPLPSMVIDYLAENTATAVKWKQITYTRGGTGSGDTKDSGDSIDLTGEAQGYAALYQQLNHFRLKSREITSVELKGYTMDPRTNTVSLQMHLVINPNFATVSTLRNKNALLNVDAPSNNTSQEVEVVTPTNTVVTQVVNTIPVTQPQITNTAGTSSKPASSTPTR